jgi:hypothetical protein
MNEEALFQQYSTNRALQATYPDFATYRDFVMSQMPASANENSGISGMLNNATSSMSSIKDLGKNLIMNKLSSKMGLGLNPIGIGGLVLSGLSGINDKIRQTDFARSKTLADYFDAKSYGGIDARNAAAVANMAQARGIQKQMAQRPSAQVSARDAAMGGGEGGSTTTGGSKGSSGGFSSSERGGALHG